MEKFTEEVKYMGGVIGGGIMVLLPALYIHLTGKEGCCGNRCGMFLSIAFAAVGVAGGLYSFIVAVLGLKNGPYCKVLLVWMTPFKDSEKGYLADSSQWIKCTEPEDIVQFHIGLFSTLLATSMLAGHSLRRSDDQRPLWLSVWNLHQERGHLRTPQESDWEVLTAHWCPLQEVLSTVFVECIFSKNCTFFF
ncbi:Transmembrane 4 L6 family member 1 [Oryzias melastigma]|uniref:Transmembrane 4 L6 family member 1 n=1 Tax=Oryzias melastigma TaxID=30732 RepID=A0A834FBZ2_ORYME|nr:Transmembrane 4 L6 family member 1 [Oryzias melastigma]